MGMGRGRTGMWDKLDLWTCFENVCWLAGLFPLVNAHLAVIWWHFHSCNMLCSCTSGRRELCPARGRLATAISRLCMCVVCTGESCCTGWKLGKKQVISLLSPSLLVSTSVFMRALSREADDWMGQRPKWHLIPSRTAQHDFGVTDVGSSFSMDRWCQSAGKALRTLHCLSAFCQCSLLAEEEEKLVAGAAVISGGRGMKYNTSKPTTVSFTPYSFILSTPQLVAALSACPSFMNMCKCTKFYEYVWMYLNMCEWFFSPSFAFLVYITLSWTSFRRPHFLFCPSLCFVSCCCC